MSAAHLLHISNAPQSSNQDAPSRTATTKILINSIYNDLEDLQQKFGRFRVFDGRCDAEHWASCLETSLKASYSNVNDICSHFHFFIDQSQFGNWFFGLSVNSWANLKEEFLSKASEIEFDYRAMAIAKQDDFVVKLRELKKNDSNFLAELTKEPITNYFRAKIRLFLMVYPRMPKSHYIQLAVSLLSDDEMAKRFSAKISRKADMFTLISYAKYEDSSKRTT